MGVIYATILFSFGIVFKAGAALDSAVSDLLTAVNCSDIDSIQLTNQQCLDLYNVALVIEDPVSLAEANSVQVIDTINSYLVTGSDVICSSQDSFTKVAICLTEVNGKCNTGSVDPPTEAQYSKILENNCESITYLRVNANHGTDIETEASCSLGTDSTTLLGLLQQCVDRNDVNIQLPAVMGSDPNAVTFVMRDLLRTNTESLCSDVKPLANVTECINYLMYKCGSGSFFLMFLSSDQDIASSFTETCDVIHRLTSVPAEVQSLTANLDCTVQNDVIAVQKQCFTMYDINIDIESPELLAAGAESSFFEITMLLAENTDILCGSLFLNASQCLYHTMFSCDTERLIDPQSFITNDVAQQFEVLCNILTDESVSCLVRLNRQLRRCIYGMTCREIQRQRACEYPLLKTCGTEAVSMFESQLLDPGCRNTPNSNVTLPDGRVHRMDCSTSKGIHEGYEDCFLYNGIYLSGSDTNGHSIDFIMGSITGEFLDDLCSNLTIYQEAVSCVMMVAKECYPSSEHDLLPDSDKVNSGLATLCSKKDDFDIDCVNGTNQTSCENHHDLDHDHDHDHDHDEEDGHLNCSGISTKHQCRLETIQACNQETRDIYKEILDWQLPTSCLTGSHVTTPPTQGGGAYFLSLSLPLLGITLGVYIF